VRTCRNGCQRRIIMNNTSPQRYDDRDYDSSFGDGVWNSIKVTTTLTFWLSAFIVLFADNTTFFNSVVYFVGVFFGITLIMNFFTLVYATILIYPMIYILCYFSLLSEISLSLTGGFILFVLLMLHPSGRFVSLFYIIIFWGMACAYAFLKGYSKGART